MKQRAFGVLLLLVVLVSASSAFAVSLTEEFLALGASYEKNVSLDLPEGVSNELSLREREALLVEKLLGSPDELASVSTQVASLEAGMLSRLADRVQFKIALEGREDLKPVLGMLQRTLQGSSMAERGKKKIANIGGREVDLYDGEWRTAPDGRQFWVSNEYGDIVLSPAEFHRYSASAVVVND